MDLPSQFLKYLSCSKVSGKTIRNYLSDLSHFLSWALLRIRTQGFIVENEFGIIPHLSGMFLREYRHFLITNNIPPRTINRRLSTLRCFGKFLENQGLLLTNPVQQLSNIEVTSQQEDHAKLLQQFKAHLETEGATSKTVHNYVSDVRGFIRFLTEGIVS